jgi:hypothetical protein
VSAATVGIENAGVPRALAPVLLALSVLLSVPARADLATAQTAYQKGDYPLAFHDYRELAELGQPLAQLNVAIMYSRGEGARQSDIYAYAWATLAAESGEARGQVLADRLRPLLAAGSEKIASDIAAPYRRSELDARLMPRVEEESANAACNHAKFPRIDYPAGPGSRGVQGNVLAEFTVMPDGRARRPRIVYSLPVGVFEPTVRSAVLHLIYPARPTTAGPAHCRLMFRFVAQGQDATSYRELQTFVSKTRTEAESGDVAAEFLYGMMLAGLPQLRHSVKDALPWFLKAAQSGARAAQYEVGESLLLGIGCQCETNKGEVWLRRAAEADQADAQVTLAQYALRGTPDDAGSRIAKTWLERAAASGSHDGKLYLAGLLAASPLAEVRDPPRALALLDEVRRDLGEDPTEYEIRAAAQAASGNYAAAVTSERKALSMAKVLGWDASPLEERLARYQGGQPWYGNLLVL